MSRTRREVLRLSAAVGVTGLAGCSALDRYGGYRSSDPRETDRPVTGEFVPELVAFDEAVLSFMNEHEIPGGVLGVSREREVVLERGYGHMDETMDEPMATDTLVRIASLSKVFTRAAIRKLVRETSALSLDDFAFELLDVEPLPGESVTPDLDAVTVGHLLEHLGGWDRTQTADPVFTQLDIALERGWNEPPDERRLIRHMLSEPLQFRPGGQRVYSNFGYIVLGELVEAVTGISYQEYLTEELLEPHGITEVALGNSLPADRPERETWYFDERSCRNVVEMKPMELVRCPDGGFHIETTGASGGHVVTVRDFLEFMRHYWLGGSPRGDQHQTWLFNGTLPGTFSKAIQTNGVDIVLVFNRRGYDPNYLEQGIRERLLGALDSIDQWPG